MHPSQGDPGLSERRGERTLAVVGGLEDDEGGRGRLCEAGEARFRGGDALALACGESEDVGPVLGDIDAEEILSLICEIGR